MSQSAYNKLLIDSWQAIYVSLYILNTVVRLLNREVH